MARADLTAQLEKHRSEIRSDGYPMSIGEIMALYKDGELDIHPEFQRFYRWTEDQKSKLIESILLGIPIPSIFVAQRKDGVWDVIDGLQRLSTIFQFAGILKDEAGAIVPPFVLRSTKYLPALESMLWDGQEEDPRWIGLDNQLIVKRAKIDVKIILRESSEQSKFELFQRLNTGGSQLEDQELRNCLLVMSNRDFYNWFRELRDVEAFRSCLLLTDRNLEEQYDLDLASRFLVLHSMGESELSAIGDIGEFLDAKMVSMASDSDLELGHLEDVFVKTFTILAEVLGEDSFKRFDQTKGKYVGGFFISSFEYFALGVGYLVSKDIEPNRDQIRTMSQTLWSGSDFKNKTGSGVRANQRIPYVVGRARQELAKQ